MTRENLLSGHFEIDGFDRIMLWKTEKLLLWWMSLCSDTALITWWNTASRCRTSAWLWLSPSSFWPSQRKEETLLPAESRTVRLTPQLNPPPPPPLRPVHMKTVSLSLSLFLPASLAKHFLNQDWVTASGEKERGKKFNEALSSFLRSACISYIADQTYHVWGYVYYDWLLKQSTIILIFVKVKNILKYQWFPGQLNNFQYTFLTFYWQKYSKINWGNDQQFHQIQ